MKTDFIAGDMFDWLRRFARRRQRFDIVILDPPSFSTTRKSRFSVERDMASLVALAAKVTQPGGWLMTATNHHQITPRAFRAQVMPAYRSTSRISTGCSGTRPPSCS
ncbi:MAG: class I SAM-dependent rRNA methyltransferase, partial [Candidatus Roseilinea sp.]